MQQAPAQHLRTSSLYSKRHGDVWLLAPYHYSLSTSIMRLLKRSSTGALELTSFDEDNLPPYAILSHTWAGEEVLYNDVAAGTGQDKAGYSKIVFCLDRAVKDGLQYCWVDTCCINKSTSDELTAAINSMFSWYRGAQKCYVHLSDVRVPVGIANAQAFRTTWIDAFRNSRWFKRGWTLQEMLAPPVVEFFSTECRLLGTRASLEQEIHDITKIQMRALRGQSLNEFTVDERMKWMADRETTMKEDKIYSLLGIFDVFLPLIYGEGVAYATMRLKEEIQKRQKWRLASNKTTVPAVSSNLLQKAELDYKLAAEKLGPIDTVTFGCLYKFLEQLLRSPTADGDHAAKLANDAMSSASQRLGACDKTVIKWRQQIAWLFTSEGYRRQALPIFDALVEDLMRQLPPGDPSLVEAETELAQCLCLLPDRSEAETLQTVATYRHLIEIEHLSPQSDVSTKAQIEARDILGILFRQRNQYLEALPLYEQALKMQMALTNNGGPDVWHLQAAIAQCYRFLNEPSKALKILEEIELAHDQAEDGSQKIDLTDTLHQMCLCYLSLDLKTDSTAYAEGKAHCERLLKIYSVSNSGALNKNTAAVHRILGEIHSIAGRHLKAAESYEHARRFSQQELGDDFCTDLTLQADELRKANFVDQGKTMLLERLAWAQRLRGAESEDVALSFAALASYAEASKDWTSSLKYRNEELEIWQNIYRAKPTKMKDCLSCIAIVSFHIGDFATCILRTKDILYNQATTIEEMFEMRKDDMVLIADIALAELYLEDWKAGKEHCEQVIDFYSTLRYVSPPLGRANVVMGRVLLSTGGDLDEAATYATRGVEVFSILERELVEDDKKWSVEKWKREAKFWLAKIQFEQGQYDGTAKLLGQCVPGLREMEKESQWWTHYWDRQLVWAERTLQICRSKSQSIS